MTVKCDLHIPNNVNILPSRGECTEFAIASQEKAMGPNEVPRYCGPDWNGQVFGERSQRDELGVTGLPNGDHLKGKVANRTGTRVRQKTITEWGLTVVIDGLVTSLGPVSVEATYPNSDKAGDESSLPEFVA